MEDCTLLLEEQLHNESVVSLKCQSQHSPRPDISPELKPEELYVQYVNNVCVINGGSLFTALRSCRSYLARRQTSGTDIEPITTSMNPKKWGFVDQNTVNDIAIVGLDLSNTFDHLLTASTCEGFDSRYRAIAPNSNLVIAAGIKPFIGFHYAIEGGTQPVLSDVAKAVASKLKSALPGWLTGAKTTPEKQSSVTLLPAEAMTCRFGLCDLRRIASYIILSPNKKIAAISDALGRVMLIDAHKGTAIRIFKGYREAQCAFIQVPDERKVKHRSMKPIALFLLIYSPKKGTLEIFSAQVGTKIATFTASKCSRLIYINYGLMGFQTTSKSRYVCQYNTLLIDPDGSIKEIIIPFHFALTEKNSKRVRDLHLYKRLKQYVKSGNYDDESLVSEAFNTCSEMKTVDIKLQLLEFLVLNREILPEVILKCVDHFIVSEAFNTCSEMKTVDIKLQLLEFLVLNREILPEVILKCVDHFIEKINLLNQSEIESDAKALKIVSENLHSLVSFYTQVTDEAQEEDITNGNFECSNALDTNAVLGVKEMENLQKLLDLSTLNNYKSHDLKVSFKENGKKTLSSFLRVFDLSVEGAVCLKKDVDEVALFQVAETIFAKYISGIMDTKELQEQSKSSSISTNDLFYLLLSYWVHRPLNIDINLEREMRNLSAVIYCLAQNVNYDDLIVDNNSTSPFWTKIRQLLMNSSKSFPALMAAILCKGVAQRIENEKEFQKSSEEDFEVWENLSQENCEWTLLIGKLEDVSLLNIILANDPICSSSLPKLKHEKESVSLRSILDKGKGSVSELVARWLTLKGIHPKFLTLNEIHHQNSLLTEQSVSQQKENPSPAIISSEDLEVLSSESVFEHLNILRKQFPYSLDCDVLLTNMAWEYALAWQKDIEEIRKLEASLSCLNQITEPHLKKGLHNMIWNTHLKILFESCCKLIRKVGKLPKERLCKQDTGLTDFQMSSFIRICTEFFNEFMDCLQESFNVEKVRLHYEPIWEDECGLPLTELAHSQNNINYDLLLLHYQLCLSMQMITTFSIKQTKFVNNLFDPSVIPLFFSDLQQKAQISWHKTESKISAARIHFLCKVVLVTIETVTIDKEKVYSTDHVTWMGRCISLARLWNLDVDFLRRYQLVQLYINGFDSVAEELLPAIKDVEDLGPRLLEVAGKRLAQFMTSSPDLSLKIGAFSTTLTQYLDTLNGEWCVPCQLNNILLLSTHSLRCLNENQTEHKLACLMIEACVALQDMQS
ncbi:hypothetical protein AMK59_8750 [Oryctes borbonicus]|uniref:Rab3-GAP regulatory subunit N-terminal domain-containing protein n=1 Tax=Oryctes borbonicus TaxID=1629725 RepID=A0A0T6AWP6_9SCAR|nr:hypothetical protein AMK59_8750 [Oryctes borbonicus]